MLAVLSFLLIMGLYFLFGSEFVNWMIFLATAAASLFHLVLFLRMENGSYAVFLLFYLSIALTFLCMILDLYSLLPLFAVTACVLFVCQIIILNSRLLRWRFQDLMRLAVLYYNERPEGMNSPDTSHGLDIGLEEVVRVAKMLFKHGIAVPLFQEEEIQFYIPRFPFFSLLWGGRFSKMRADTVITFGKGQIIAVPSEKDYMKYGDDISLEDFRASLEKLFASLIGLCHKGGIQKFIRELDELSRV